MVYSKQSSVPLYPCTIRHPHWKEHSGRFIPLCITSWSLKMFNSQQFCHSSVWFERTALLKEVHCCPPLENEIWNCCSVHIIKKILGRTNEGIIRMFCTTNLKPQNDLATLMFFSFNVIFFLFQSLSRENTAELLCHVFERKLSLRKSQGFYHILLIALKTTYIHLACKNQVLHAVDVHNVLFSVVYIWAFLYMTHFQSCPTAVVHMGVWITLMQLKLSYFSVLLFIIPINIALLSLSPSFPLPVLVEGVIYNSVLSLLIQASLKHSGSTK